MHMGIQWMLHKFKTSSIWTQLRNLEKSRSQCFSKGLQQASASQIMAKIALVMRKSRLQWSKTNITNNRFQGWLNKICTRGNQQKVPLQQLSIYQKPPQAKLLPQAAPALKANNESKSKRSKLNQFSHQKHKSKKWLTYPTCLTFTDVLIWMRQPRMSLWSPKRKKKVMVRLLKGRKLQLERGTLNSRVFQRVPLHLHLHHLDRLGLEKQSRRRKKLNKRPLRLKSLERWARGVRI